MNPLRQPSVTAIVLNWNNACATARCLQSLNQLDFGSYEITVVDNCSTDDSVQTIRQQYPWVTILEAQTNLGYAGGNIIGIRFALAHGADMVFILNNDAIVEPDSLSLLVAAMEGQAGVGIVGALIAEMSSSRRAWALGLAVDWQTGNVHRLHAGDAISALQKSPPLEVDCCHNQPGLAQPTPDALVFNGALTYDANYDAVQYFLADIYPLIQKRIPEASLTITGSTSGMDLAGLRLDDSVLLSGYVHDGSDKAL